MSGKGLNRFVCSGCVYYKTCLKQINYSDASECSSKMEQQKIKKEVKRNDYDSQSNY